MTATELSKPLLLEMLKAEYPRIIGSIDFFMMMSELEDRGEQISEMRGNRCTLASSGEIEYYSDRWEIGISYYCTGEWSEDMGDYWTPPSVGLDSMTGSVTGIEAVYHDPETDDEVFFTTSDLTDLRDEIDNAFRDML